MNPRKCLDDNPKTVIRKYNWDDQIVEFSLCEKHRQDPDFDHYFLEKKI